MPTSRQVRKSRQKASAREKSVSQEPDITKNGRTESTIRTAFNILAAVLGVIAFGFLIVGTHPYYAMTFVALALIYGVWELFTSPAAIQKFPFWTRCLLILALACAVSVGCWPNLRDIFVVSKSTEGPTAQATPTVSTSTIQETMYMECGWDHLPIHLSRDTTVHVIRLHPDFLRTNPNFPTAGAISDVNAPDKSRDWPSKTEGRWMTRTEVQNSYKTGASDAALPFIFKCTATSSKAVDDATLEMIVSTLDNRRHPFSISIDPLSSVSSFSFYVVNVCPVGVYVTWPGTATVHALDETGNRQVPLKFLKRDWPGDFMIFGASEFLWNGIDHCDWK